MAASMVKAVHPLLPLPLLATKTVVVRHAPGVPQVLRIRLVFPLLSAILPAVLPATPILLEL